MCAFEFCWKERAYTYMYLPVHLCVWVCLCVMCTRMPSGKTGRVVASYGESRSQLLNVRGRPLLLTAAVTGIYANHSPLPVRPNSFLGKSPPLHVTGDYCDKIFHIYSNLRHMSSVSKAWIWDVPESVKLIAQSRLQKFNRCIRTSYVDSLKGKLQKKKR